MKKSEEKIQYLSKVYNAYAKQYNQANNKIDITNSFSQRCDLLKNDLQEISEMLGKYGFTSEDISKIIEAKRKNDEPTLKQVKLGLQAFVDYHNFNEQEYRKALKQIEEYGRQYEQTEVNFLIVQRIVYVTTQNGYPENIPLWNELSKDEKEIIKTGRPKEFDEQKTLEWYNELKELKEYQHKNGKPHKTGIKKEIMQRFKDTIGYSPSMSLLNIHFRDLGLT